MVKNLPVIRETWVRSLGREDPWRRKWKPTPVFLPGEFHEQRTLVGLSPWGRKESDTTMQITHTCLEYVSLDRICKLSLLGTLRQWLFDKYFFSWDFSSVDPGLTLWKMNFGWGPLKRLFSPFFHSVSVPRKAKFSVDTLFLVHLLWDVAVCGYLLCAGFLMTSHSDVRLCACPVCVFHYPRDWYAGGKCPLLAHLPRKHLETSGL